MLDQSPQPGGAWQYRWLSLTLRAEIPGEDRFQGRQLHTKDYRGPWNSPASTSLIVGAGISATLTACTLCDPSLLDYE